jgi:hypothetical protein
MELIKGLSLALFIATAIGLALAIIALGIFWLFLSFGLWWTLGMLLCIYVGWFFIVVNYIDKEEN